VSTIVVFAHLGHWYVGGPIYLGPFLLLGAWIKFAEWRDRRRGHTPSHDRDLDLEDDFDDLFE
jgi:hypothetical protein